MAFVVEELSQEEGIALGKELNLTNPVWRTSKEPEPLDPRRKAIDKENDAVVIGVGQGRGAYVRDKSEGPGIYYDMFWQGKRVRAMMRVDEHHGQGIFSWVLDIIYMPKSLEAEQDKAVELIKAGIACLEEPFEHEKEKYTYEGFVGPDPVVVVEDDEVEDKV